MFFCFCFSHEEIKHVWLCGTWSAILPSIPCVSTFTADLAQSVFSFCLREWIGGKKKNNRTSRVSDCNFSADVNRSWQKNLFTNKTVLHYLTKFNTTLLFFFFYPLLFYRLYRGLTSKEGYSCLNDSQEEGGPARIFSVALFVVSPLPPALEPGW